MYLRCTGATVSSQPKTVESVRNFRKRVFENCRDWETTEPEQHSGLCLPPSMSDFPALRNGFDRRWKAHFPFWTLEGLIEVKSLTRDPTYPDLFPSLCLCRKPLHRATHEFAPTATQVRQDGFDLLRRRSGERGRLRLRRWSRALHSEPTTRTDQAGTRWF